MNSLLIIAIVAVAMIGVMVPSVFAYTTMPDDGKPDGHIPVLDDKIVIVDHNGLSYLQDSLDWYSSGSIIYGDIVNVSEDTLYYVIIRGNVYDDGKLLDDTGYQQPYIFRYDYPFESERYDIELAISPYKVAIHPGESAQFALWPGQVGWDCYEVWIESYESENKFKGISEENLRNDLEINSVKDERGVLKGKVYNPTENILDYTYVVVAKYDENGNLFALKGDSTSSLGPGKTKNFEIPLYVDNYPIKTHLDNFIYGKPANYEVSAWGYNAWDYGEWEGSEYDKNPVKYLGESKFFPNKDTTNNVNVDEEIQNKENRQTSSCLKDSNQVFERSDYTHTIPEWIKNNAGWWANGDIDEKEFLSAIDYLLSNEILRINIPREKFSMELDSQTYYVSKYDSQQIKLSGWYESHKQATISCELWKPNNPFSDNFTILRDYVDDRFEQPISLNLDWEPGEYTFECSHDKDDFPSLSFIIVHGDPPKTDEKIKPKVPSWIKNNSGWWADGTIDDSTFLTGLEYLVQNGIIDAGRYNSVILEN